MIKVCRRSKNISGPKNTSRKICTQTNTRLVCRCDLKTDRVSWTVSCGQLTFSPARRRTRCNIWFWVRCRSSSALPRLRSAAWTWSSDCSSSQEEPAQETRSGNYIQTTLTKLISALVLQIWGRAGCCRIPWWRLWRGRSGCRRTSSGTNFRRQSFWCDWRFCGWWVRRYRWRTRF